MGGISASSEDKSGMKAKVKTMYGRINSQFNPDPKWVVPWEKEDSMVPSVNKFVSQDNDIEWTSGTAQDGVKHTGKTTSNFPVRSDSPDVQKYNPNHGADGRFGTGENAHTVVGADGSRSLGPAHPDYVAPGGNSHGGSESSSAGGSNSGHRAFHDQLAGQSIDEKDLSLSQDATS